MDTLGLTLFSKENLVFDHDLGEGAFGKVNIFLDIFFLNFTFSFQSYIYQKIMYSCFQKPLRVQDQKGNLGMQ